MHAVAALIGGLLVYIVNRKPKKREPSEPEEVCRITLTFPEGAEPTVEVSGLTPNVRVRVSKENTDANPHHSGTGVDAVGSPQGSR